MAALIIAVASQFRQVSQIDSAVRIFCVKSAAIPREAVASYRLFVAPRNSGTALEFIGNGHRRSACARIMRLGETAAALEDARYEELMHTGLVFFASSQPTRELRDRLRLLRDQLRTPSPRPPPPQDVRLTVVR